MNNDVKEFSPKLELRCYLPVLDIEAPPTGLQHYRACNVCS